MKRIHFMIAFYIGKAVMAITKILPKISGTTWPGGIANIIMKNFIKYFEFKPETRIVMVTGTGGKTTTTGMLAQLVESEGKTVCTNAIGANMERGVATALIRSANKSGVVECDYVILEVDERYLPIVSSKITPHVILVTNVLKDQSQRNGEPGVIMQKISSAIGRDVHLILNGDEPNATSLGMGKPSVSYYSVAGEKDEDRDTNEFTVNCSCPVCHSPITYEYENLLNIGKFKCTGCDLKSEEDATIVSVNPTKNYITVDDKKFDVKYVSKDFMYCYSSMIAFAKYEGVSDAGIQKSINDFQIQSGRVEQMYFGGRTINYLRIKQETPVTLQSAINVTAADKKEKIVVLDLSEVVDFTPNYTGMYYAYDCDLTKLIKSNVKKYICMSNVIAYDQATRLILEGVDKEDISVLPTNSYDKLLKELENYDCDSIYLLTWMHSYYDCLNSVEKYKKGKGI